MMGAHGTSELRTMCLGLTGQVVRLSADMSRSAEVDVDGHLRQVDVSLLADSALAAGDWVVIHAGFALEKISEVEARAAQTLRAAQ